MGGEGGEDSLHTARSCGLGSSFTSRRNTEAAGGNPEGGVGALLEGRGGDSCAILFTPLPAIAQDFRVSALRRPAAASTGDRNSAAGSCGGRRSPRTAGRATR